MMLNDCALALIHLYQKATKNNGSHLCRYTPSCSHYGEQAFLRHGFFCALVLTIARILRCNRFARGGYDPVPPNAVERRIIAVRSVLEPASRTEYLPRKNTAVIDA